VGSRRRGRELAVQTLYAMELNPSDGHSSVQQFSGDERSDFDAVDFAEDLVKGVVTNQSIIDRTIEEKSKNWSKSRMPKVDLSILRMATFELLLRNDIPKNVTINEAIEVAKKFGTEESPAFINGILDEIAAALPEKN
jgi:N utilization substance protein B